MTSKIMEMISPKRLWKVVGIAFKGGNEPVVHVDEGRLYAAMSDTDAVTQARKFWTEDMGFDSYSGAHARLIDRVDGYKVVLIDDRPKETQE